jgi:hypothetical protein
MTIRILPVSGMRFQLGKLVITRGARELLADHEIERMLSMHAQGEWGLVGDEDWKANEEALEDGLRILSSYTADDGERIWVITEADRSATTILKPSEY